MIHNHQDTSARRKKTIKIFPHLIFYLLNKHPFIKPIQIIEMLKTFSMDALNHLTYQFQKKILFAFFQTNIFLIFSENSLIKKYSSINKR